MKLLLTLLLFIGCLALSTFLTQPIYRAELERDLTRKVTRVLKSHDLATDGIIIKGHHLTSIPETPDDPDQAQELHEGLDGIYGLYVDLPEAPTNTPPSLSFTTIDGKLTLTGEIPSEKTRRQILSSFEGSKLEVIDQLEIKENALSIEPLSSLTELFPLLTQTAESPSLSWTPESLQLQGTLATQKELSVLHSAAQKLNPNAVTELKVIPFEPTSFRLARSDQNDLTLSGVFPNSQTRDLLLAEIKKSAPKIKVIDKSTIATRSTTAWWHAKKPSWLSPILAKTTGPFQLDLSDSLVETSAHFPKPSDLASFQNRLSKLPAHLNRTQNLTTEKPQLKPENKPQPHADNPTEKTAPKEEPKPSLSPAEIKTINTKFEPLSVYFGTGSSRLDKKASSKIKQSAKLILASVPADQKITVGGYADLRGIPENNRKLSLRRAAGVRDRLIALGVPESQLILNHFGEDTSRTASSELWKSRRVQLSLANPSPKTTP